MILLLTFLVLALSFYILTRSHWPWYISQARRKGFYPQKGKATMFDVRRFVLMGEKNLAIRVYREIFSTNYKEAKKAVDELEKSIQEKKIERE